MLSANLFRGAFGSLLHQSHYARLFRPINHDDAHGQTDAPRPFVFRTRHLDGSIHQPGDSFHVDVHLFTLAHDITKHFSAVFSQFETIGFGPGRTRASLQRIDGPSTLALPPDQFPSAITALRVEFLTATELKHRGSIVEVPSFPALWSRTCHRLESLSNLYGEGPLSLGSRELHEHARNIRLMRYQFEHVEKKRRSSRTGQVHPLGGFLGWAEYEGSLDRFLPYLQAARWTGIGRQTVWGKGEIAIQP